ncbi:aluminum-activated malate transporter 2-like [Salvia miltiorrhiza]|uniref:aluminum-activated malate transporter 2-like n=1 Tax=Salvia miltiorrhiza TaxID=226208 RepID=UPI0025AB5FF3|nr:aluminum-activated malate transporter 2-like [Salvia miltiorrhiza]
MMGPEEPEKPSIPIRGWLWFRDIPSKLLAKLHEVARQAIKVAKDDPRRLIHSLKVGLTVTLVSLLYYLRPLYNNFGASAMWAVMTVVVVFEFSVGGTIGKCLNRGLATLAAAALAIGAHHLAILIGKKCEPYLIGVFVFIQAVAMTFVRFFPKVKAKYDYGMLIFVMTFSLVSISGLRMNEVLELAQARLVTILIGASTCLAVCILICPVWAGEDLHRYVAQNISQLGNFLEGHTDQCFKTSCDAWIEITKPSVVNLNSILVDSKGREETLANLAGWEPGHGQFMYRHPWKQYLKIGNLTRQCACRLEAINGCFNSNFQAPPEIQCTIEVAFSESGKALKELAWAVETMTKPSSANPHIANLKIASRNLKSILKSGVWGEGSDILQIIPVAAAMIDTVSSVEQICVAVNELSFMAKFKSRNGSGVEGESEIGHDKSCIEIGMAEIPSLSVAIDGGIEISAEAEEQILMV